MNPLSIIIEAIKTEPAMRYGQAVAAIFAIISIGISLTGSLKTAIIGSVAVIILMILILIFAHLASDEAIPDGRKKFRFPGLILMWFSVLAVVVWGSLLSSAFFFGRPKFAACNINPTLCQITSPYIPRPNVRKAAESDIALAKSLIGVWRFHTEWTCDGEAPQARLIYIKHMGRNLIQAENIEESSCFKKNTLHFTGHIKDGKINILLRRRSGRDEDGNFSSKSDIVKTNFELKTNDGGQTLEYSAEPKSHYLKCKN